MPERRRGIDPQRATQLESLLQKAFNAAGIYMGPEMTPSRIGDYLLRDMESQSELTYFEALRRYMDSESVDIELQFFIGAVWGDLYEVGDTKILEERLRKTEERIASKRV